MWIKLKDVKFFEWIDIESINNIIDNSRRIEYKAGDVVLFQWATSNGSAYIIQDGSVKVEIDDNEVAKIWEWEIFWEIALITDEPRVASVIADTDLVLLKITKELLHTIIKDFKNGPEIQEILMKRILENIQK